MFTRVALTNASATVYDVEAGDVDLDGDVDLIGAIITTNGDNSARLWMNGGDGTTWNTWANSSDILPGIADYQRLSADLIDFDQDGDLDLYLTGSDGSGPWGFGMSPNQFWENDTLGMQLAIAGSCPGEATVTISAATPDTRIAILGSDELGTTILDNGPCVDTIVDLIDPQVLTTLTVDGAGGATLTPNIGAAFCDHFVQIVEVDECAVSNLVPVP